jgi:hypothetical protein
LERVTTAITALLIDQQRAAWGTFHALLQDRTDSACAISTAEPAVAAVMQAEWDSGGTTARPPYGDGDTILPLSRTAALDETERQRTGEPDCPPVYILFSCQ